MDMDKWTIILIAAAVSIVWMMGKRYFGRNKQKKDESIYMDVNTWFHKAQEMIAAVEEDIKKERAAKWGALSEEEKIKNIEEFMIVTFGPMETKKYTVEEKLRLGKTNFLLRGY